jgi:uncharacterized protein (TIGR00299 family) protein
MKKRILYFDCFAGIAGDMTVGALLDLGVDFKLLKSKLLELKIGHYKLDLKRTLKHGISGLKFDVILDHEHNHDENHHHHHAHTHNDKHNHSHDTDHHHHHNHEKKHSHQHEHHHHSHDHVHRNLHDVTEIINSSAFNENVKKLALDMFIHVAKAEAKVHDKPIDEIHFHEVGAIDSIVDILGAAFCFDQLKIDEVYSSPIPTGNGFVKCAHGLMPVPAPATLEILAYLPVKSTTIEKELTTPTGAAIIKTLVNKFEKPAKMNIIKTGYGCGTRDLEIPNMVRVTLAEIEKETTDSDTVIALITNIDDMNPEIYSNLFDKLFECKTLDVWIENIQMKKNRPANKLVVLCKSADVKAVEKVIFQETSTFGIRRKEFQRSTLVRKFIEIETELGHVHIKQGYYNGELIKSIPEYEDCLKLAKEHNLPLIDVYEIVKKSL